MRAPFSDAIPGQLAYVSGESSFCSSSYEKILNVFDRYDGITGEKYLEIECESGTYDSRTGNAIDAPTAYSIYHIKNRELEKFKVEVHKTLSTEIEVEAYDKYEAMEIALSNALDAFAKGNVTELPELTVGEIRKIKGE